MEERVRKQSDLGLEQSGQSAGFPLKVVKLLRKHKLFILLSSFVQTLEERIGGKEKNIKYIYIEKEYSDNRKASLSKH